MKIAIVGFDTEGRACYDYFNSQATNQITICDQKTDLTLPNGVSKNLGSDYLQGLEAYDVVVRTPGLHPDKIVAASPQAADNITSSTNEFIRVSPSRNIIGITGTKGKGTTSTLVATLLESAGKRVHLGGNIGIPAIELLKNNILPDDYVVLELSSFQLIDLQQSPHVAACLMVVPEHLDWHTSEEEYFAAKQNLFRWQTSDDLAVYFSSNTRSIEIASAGLASKIPYFEKPGAIINNNAVMIDDQVICNTADIKLLGGHNLQNICAAVTIAWNVLHDISGFKAVLSSFGGLEHRLELVREVSGVRYYDDSFGTTPETAIVAIEAFTEPKVVILGGSDKGADYTQLANAVATATIGKVLLIGQQASRIQAALEAVGFTNFQAGGDTMQDIVTTAQSVSKPGEVVLLSTGCASFDMFANYKDRGNQFKTAVQALVVAD